MGATYEQSMLGLGGLRPEAPSCWFDRTPDMTSVKTFQDCTVLNEGKRGFAGNPAIKVIVHS